MPSDRCGCFVLFCVLVVISPLRSLMEDQIGHPNNMGVLAIAITDEEDVEIIQQVMNGNCVFALDWRSIFDCQSFKEMLIGVAISPHTVSADVLVFDRSQRYFQTFNLGESVELFPSLRK